MKDERQMTIREACEELRLASSAPLLQKISTGAIEAREVCGRTCVRVADIEEMKAAAQVSKRG